MPDAARPNAVIRFEPDGYDIRQTWLMGRQVAGHGYLRAAVAARGAAPLFCFTPAKASADAFGRLVREIDPATSFGWLQPGQLSQVGRLGGVLYVPDASVATASRMRLAAGVAAYSLCGVTHTTATSRTLQEIADLLTAPVAPWDALICTTEAVAETVRRVHAAETEALRWRLGDGVTLSTPQLPVIPLGVHCADFELGPGEPQAARAALDIAPDEVVIAFVGRLTYSGKQHPFAMYHALQAVAARTSKRLVLVQCGWSPNDFIAEVFESAPRAFAPDVRTITVDGRAPAVLRRTWAAADIFMSLSDGIQETFGLTPVEAMAAGLPCVVSDWNGYRDTVRDGVDGFRVPTWAPAPGAAGRSIALEQQVGGSTYDRYLWLAAAGTVVDLAATADRLTTLVEDADLRRTMGEAGRRRAREVFDWSVVMGQYQALWAELNARRAAAQANSAEAAWIARAPAAAAAWLDPFHAFGHYPTAHIDAATRVTLHPGASLDLYRERRAHPLFRDLTVPETLAAAFLQRAGQGATTVAEVADAARIPADAAAYVAGQLAKMGIVRLG
jgi:alpha-maltose-1-phosphate synthase